MALRAGLAETCKLGYTGSAPTGNAVNRGGAGIPASPSHANGISPSF